MNIKFHYYITYLIANRAGYTPEESETLAYSAQLVDDNIYNLDIYDENNNIYKTKCSQTYNILKPKKELISIYPLFHFFPGDYNNKEHYRKDGKFSLLNTTPDSKNINKIFNKVLKYNNLYMTGICSHVYADTWAHQNFIGYYDDFNSMKGLLEVATPNIGHADAGIKPDIVNLKWQDNRLLDEIRNNNEIFLNASVALLKKLSKVKLTKEDIEFFKEDIIFILTNKMDFISKIKIFSKLDLYGKKEIKKYKKDKWFNDIIKRRFFFFKYMWKNNKYKNYHYYKFQEALKEYKKIAYDYLDKNVYNKMDLKNI